MPRRRAIRLARRDRALQPVYISRVGATVRTSTHRPRVCTSTPATSMRPAAGIWPRVRPHSRRSSRRTAAGKRSLASGAVARYSRARLARCLMRRTKVRAYGARTLYKARARIEQGVDGSRALSGSRSDAKRPPGTSDQSSVSQPAFARSNSSTWPSHIRE
jgi:hypothetical protein